MPNEPIVLLLPNSGVGSRMNADRPKQYLDVNGKSVLRWTLSRFEQASFLSGIVLINSETDIWWDSSGYKGSVELRVVTGGAERVDSVYNGCIKVLDDFGENAWVLVHDVARPLVLLSDVQALIEHCMVNNEGGLLAVPIPDTVKHRNPETDRITTIDRTDLYCAQTPQLFKAADVVRGIDYSRSQNIAVTDESSVIEALGLPVHIVQGNRLNIKLTYPEDISFIESFLSTSHS